jgi:hypothetical protein
MDHNSLKRAIHPPCSPDLTPSDFCLFEYLKNQLHGPEFTERPEFVSTTSEILNQIPTDTLIDGFDNPMRRLQRCIDISGKYVE